MFDLWCKERGILHQVVGLKYFNIFGPYEDHKGSMASMVYHMTNQIKEKGFVCLFESTDPQIGHGEQSRDFLYVKDAAKITCSFLHTNKSGIFNIGSGYATTWNMLATLIANTLGRECCIRYISMPDYLRNQYQNKTKADVTKLHKYIKSLGISLYTLESAISDYINNYLLIRNYAEIIR